MNLLAAPPDLSSKDVPLRDDIRLLGRILGDTLREQEGDVTFELIENVRRSAVRFRKSQDDRDRAQLEQVLEYEATLQDIAGDGAEFREGWQAFLEKRLPHY